MVIWIIGMSASGKTTIGNKLYDRLKNNATYGKWVLIDGDALRNMMGEDLTHSKEDRLKNAYRMSNLCKFLAEKDINVIACALSNSHENQKYNRDNISEYKEVYLNVDFDLLMKRDNKNLYKQAIQGKINNVIGVDIKFNPPKSPNLIIDNNTDLNYDKKIDSIIKELDINIRYKYSYVEDDIINNKNIYKYSLFEGEVFLKKYTSNRNKAQKLLNYKLEKLNNIFNNKNKNKNFIIKRYNIGIKISKKFCCELSIIKNKSKVILFLINYLENLINTTIVNLDILFTLISKFENTKKIYFLSDDKLTQGEDDLLSYILFSLILQESYFIGNIDKIKKVVIFNSILKLNDIIVSFLLNITTLNEITLSLVALEQEEKLFNLFKEEYI